MTPRKEFKRQKPEEMAAAKRRDHKVRPPQNEPRKAPEEDISLKINLTSLENQAAILASAHSDERRARLLTGLQQTRGNAYVQRLVKSPVVQAKLTVNPPDDVYEREANRVAETVQRQEEEEEEISPKLAADIQRQPLEEEEVMAKPVANLQRQEEEEEILPKLAADIQRQPLEEEEELVQAKAVESPQEMVSDSVEVQIDEARGGGQPLDGTARQSLEARLGHDFSQVRIHTDGRADHLSRKLGAEAFTTGSDIFFRDGSYQPQSGSGKGLIAHELTHVVQQQAAPAIQRQETATAEAPAATGLDETRAAALRAIWEASVVRPIEQAYEALAGETPDAEGAITSLASVEAPLGAIKNAYQGVEPAFSRLSGFYQFIARKVEELRPHTRAPLPLEQIREGINPSGETLPAWLGRISEAI